MTEHYYKFRSLQNLRYFLDILINERLYAARYDELNDPMEGAYMIDFANRSIIHSLKTKKDKTRICSLSKDFKHTLLWSHYADSHNGCCIEVSAKNTKEHSTTVIYQEGLPEIQSPTEGRNLLSHKSQLWEYENEVRYFRKTPYFNINIHSIIFGQRISNEDFKFYEKLIHSINPAIQVRKISEREIIDGFNHP